MFTSEQKRMLDKILDRSDKPDNFIKNIVNQGWCSKKQESILQDKLSNILHREDDGLGDLDWDEINGEGFDFNAFYEAGDGGY